MANPDNIMDDILMYELEQLDDQETIELFQKLVNTGLAWQLQGHYGRTAAAMIQAGLITNPRSVEHD